MRSIRTARLELEPLRASHAAEMFPILSQPEIHRYDPEQCPQSIESLARRYVHLETRISRDHREGWLNWIVRLGETRAAMGFVQATLYEDATASIAYVLSPAAQGKGYAREAARAMMSEIEGEYGVRKFRASTDPLNERSIRVLYDLGFRMEPPQAGATESKGDVFFSRDASRANPRVG